MKGRRWVKACAVLSRRRIADGRLRLGRQERLDHGDDGRGAADHGGERRRRPERPPTVAGASTTAGSTPASGGGAAATGGLKVDTSKCTAPTGDKVKLQLQWVAQSQFAGYFAAVDKGFFKDAGLDVEIVAAGRLHRRPGAAGVHRRRRLRHLVGAQGAGRS